MGIRSSKCPTFGALEGVTATRLEMMFWIIIAPELILAWAVRQWFAAWEIRDMVNGTRKGVSFIIYSLAQRRG